MTDLAEIVAKIPDSALVREWRRQMGMTQREAGFVVGVSRKQWGRYELGYCKFPKAKWRDLLVINQVTDE